MDAMQISGEEVLGLPGQNLSAEELRLLVMLADGESNQAMSDALSMPVPALRFVENSAVRKLGARSRSHLISRAFMLGVLLPRALAVSLAVLLLIGLVQHAMAPTAPETNIETMAGGTRGPVMQDLRYNGHRLASY